MQTILKFKRIKNQLNQIKQNPPTRWKVIEVDQLNWDCWITCDSSCPFYGVPFLLKICFPQNYPEEAPIFNLINPEKFFHPNISFSGVICHKTVTSKDMIRTRERIQSFLNLLQNPNPKSPYNSIAAKMYENQGRKYFRTALLIFRGDLKKETIN